MFFKEGWGLMIPIYLESHLRIMNIKLSGGFYWGWLGKVVSIYEKNSQIDSESGCRIYQYFDMRLSFCLDLSNKAHSILIEDYPVKPESKLN